MLKTLRASPEGCLSDYRVDKLIAKELPSDDDSAARAHVATCARCAQRVRDAESAAARFATEAPPWDGVVRAAATAAPATPASDATPAKRPARRLSRLASTVAFVAAAAVVVLAIRARPPGDSDGDGDGARTKGSGHVGFYVKRGDAVWAGKSGAEVRPGDVVRFTYTSATPGFLAIVSVNASRRVDVLYPDGAQAASAPAGREVALPQGTVLGDALGPERVWGLFCDRPIDLEPLRRAWQAGPGEPAAPSGCHADVVTWTKRAP